MKDEASRIYGYTFISKAISKFRLSTKVYIIICHELLMWMQIPTVLCLRHAVVPWRGGGGVL